ncbi:MAG: hypothetical protein ACIARR_12115 [Phycisphaerales bacterium JB059]
MLLSTLVLSMSVAQAAPQAPMSFMPVTPVQTAAPVIDLRQQMVEGDLGSRGYELLDGISEASQRERERLGAGEDAARAIYVRAFDAIFVIDPFEEVEELIPRPIRGGETIRAQRQLFGEFSLETDRKLFDWSRVEATAELFRILETARLDWLRTNGYFGVRTFVNEQIEHEAEARSEIRPRATFRRPADMPRTRSREQVRGTDRAEDAAAMLASSDAPMRISAPTYNRSQVRISMPGRDAGESIAAREGETERDSPRRAGI